MEKINVEDKLTGAGGTAGSDIFYEVQVFWAR